MALRGADLLIYPTATVGKAATRPTRKNGNATPGYYRNGDMPSPTAYRSFL